MSLDKERAKRNLNEILDRMLNDADTAQLHEYYKLFKKEIPLFKRSWAAAWLFKYYNEKESPSINSKSDENPQSVSLSDDESTKLFISIGKNRKVFPKDIITLIISKTQSVREDIGRIRILDNFSFVQVRDAKAEEIIKVLTGHKFRGRTLTVNFAKTKTDAEVDDN